MARTQIRETLLATGGGGTTFLGLGKNRIINGEMMIDQVNGGASTSVNSTTERQSVDMWVGRGTNAEGVFSLQQSTSTPPTGFTHFVRIQTTTASASPAAGSQYVFRHKFEGLSVRDFLAGTSSAKSFTVSFWVRSSLTGTFSCSFATATSRYYVANYTINSANTWEYKTVSVAGDTGGGALAADTSNVFNLFFDVGNGTNYDTTAGSWGSAEKYRTSGSTRLISTLNATLDVTGVQLELGTVATAFEYRPPQIELMLCQRYYWKSFPQGTAVAQNSGTQRGSIAYRAPTSGTTNPTNSVHFRLPVSQRAIGTITFYNPNAANANWRNATTGADSGAGTVVQNSEDTVTVRSAQAAGDTLTDTIIVHLSVDARL